jgi:hypothetical protein
MIELLTTYNLAQIAFVVITLALGFKGLITYLQWFKNWIFKTADKKNEIEELKKYQQILENNQKKMQEEMNKILQKVDLLIESDKDDIKAWVTERHHFFCYQQGWIDDHSLDCLERRYEKYQEENGNSFISDLMQELRRLPKVPPMDN